MYITLLILPLLATGCGGRKETAQTMPIPEISVARPTVQNITLTKEYPGYLTSKKTVDLVGRASYARAKSFGESFPKFAREYI